MSKFSRELSALLGIKATPSTAYHLQTNGQTEHMNQEIETYLRIFINHHQDDWVDWLPLAEFSYNNHTHSSTHQTPFELNSGQHPHIGTKPLPPSLVQPPNDFSNHMP